MKPPIRLLDDDRFSASLRAGLREAQASSPVDYDERAGLERFTALVAVPVVGIAAAATTKAAAASATALSGSVAGSAGTVSAVAVGGVKAAIGVKLAIGIAAAASLIGGSVYLATRPASVPPQEVAPSATIQVVAPVETPKIVETVAELPRVQPIAPPTAKPTVAPSASADPKSAVKAEMSQYAEIRAALGDPARALALANEGHAKFPRGVFWQEREVVAIQALQRLGRADEAKRRSDAFVAAHPESVYAETLRGGAPPAASAPPKAP